MCDMPISAEKIEMQSASALFLRDLLTVEEAAERLKLAPKTIRKLCLSRRLTAIRVQRSWRIPLAALDEFLLERLILRV
jgi:excisionase family DNA binding protein